MSGDSHASPALTHCENCATPLAGPYCHQCGQHAIDYRRSFHHLAHDVLENLFHFDGKFLVSVAWLLAKPGRLTAEFNAGRRQSQVPPLRFYIFVTVLFFFGVHLLNHGHLIPVRAAAVDTMSQEVRQKVKAAVEQRKAAANQPGATLGKRTIKVGPYSTIEFDESSRVGRVLEEKFANGEIGVPQLLEALEHRVPTLLFLGMPVYALLLLFFFRGSGRYYIEHLVFSLHLHTWAFLAIMIGGGYLQLATLGPVWLSDFAWVGLYGWMVWYVIAAAHKVYGGSWGRTLFNVSAAAILYVAALLAIWIGIATLTLLWLAYE